MTPSKKSAARWSDGTLGLLAHGYAWLPNRMRGTIDGTVRTRLLGRPAIALRGPEAVAFFSDEKHVVRAGALPDPVLDTLLGQGAGHTLDGDRHAIRKAVFVTLLKDGTGVATLGGHVSWRWREAMDRRRGDAVVLFHEAAGVLAQAVCDWAGVPLSDAEVAGLARDCTAMVDGFATPGPRHVRARRARRRQEEAMAALISGIRLTPEAETKQTALETVAWHREAGGNLLDVHTAAVELLHLIRPTVAVAWFAAFAAHALHRWPHHRDLLRSDPDGTYATAFAHEVRRFYPFAPFVAGFAAHDLVWKGEDIAKDTLVLLDLYGQNHDATLFEHPYRFDPDRFDPQRYSAPGHRSPGEDITVTALATIAAELARMEYEVPAQDLTIPLNRMPTRPRSGFELRPHPGTPRK